MPRQLHRLTDEIVASLEEPRLHADGAGLYIRIGEDGSRRWCFIYHRPRRREMGLGALEKVPLQVARRAAVAARRQLAAGIDPINARRAM